MIAVVDIGLSNVNSVGRALTVLRIEHLLTSDPSLLAQADRLILPGVGSFSEAARRLEATGLKKCIRALVLDHGKPILGICLGMQLLAEDGEENGKAKGLGLIKARVQKLRTHLRLPHIGWNEVGNRGTSLLADTPDGTCFYFVHSFTMVPEETVQTATSDHGVEFVAVVQKHHIIGTQFHPEKSQANGLALLKRFANHTW